jgi:hypothetical protein
MATVWTLTKGLDHFRGHVNSRFPFRDKKSDGTIGDLAHQEESASGHNPDLTGKAEYRDGDKLNEVRAWDMDSDLLDRFGYTAEKLVQYLVSLGRSGVYLPFRYFIFNKRIWKKSTGWKTQSYNGPSAHTEHIHFSGDYGTAATTEKADSWNGDLGISKIGLPAKTQEDDLTDPKTIQEIADAVWDKVELKNAYTGVKQTPGMILSYVPSRQPHLDTQKLVGDVKADVDSLKAQIAELKALLLARPQV